MPPYLPHTPCLLLYGIWYHVSGPNDGQQSPQGSGIRSYSGHMERQLPIEQFSQTTAWCPGESAPFWLCLCAAPGYSNVGQSRPSHIPLAFRTSTEPELRWAADSQNGAVIHKNRPTPRARGRRRPPQTHAQCRDSCHHSRIAPFYTRRMTTWYTERCSLDSTVIRWVSLSPLKTSFWLSGVMSLVKSEQITLMHFSPHFHQITLLRERWCFEWIN